MELSEKRQDGMTEQSMGDRKESTSQWQLERAEAGLSSIVNGQRVSFSVTPPT